LPYNRVCFTFSRSSGGGQGFKGAVARNRARRLGKEAFRLLRPQLCCGYDLVLLVFPEAELKKTSTLSYRAEQLNFLFTKAGLLR
jgi:ribonuclease P protein component